VSPTSDPRLARPEAAAALPDAVLAEINRLWTIVRAFSNVAHDVNNALQVIAGNAELLAAQPLAQDVARRVDTMRVQALRAAMVIDRLLKYTRAQELADRQIDVWPVVEAAVALRTASLNRRRIRLTAERDDIQPIVATADHAVLLQALLDLLLAAENGAPAQAGARIVVRAMRRENHAVVEVVATAPAASAGSPGAIRASGTRTPAGDASPESAKLPAHLSLTRGSELWAAAHLAAALGGEVKVSESEREMTLSLLLAAD
jgi:signal transduction histidine kinase